MPKAQHKNQSNKLAKNVRFSEVWLLIFVLIFGIIGSYTWLKSFAATEDVSFLVQSNVSAEEKAWFGSVSSAALIILAAGPIAAFLFWWIWRRSAMELWAKLLLTIVPFLIVMAFT